MHVTQAVSLAQVSALELGVNDDGLQTDVRSAVFIGVSQHLQRIKTKI